MLFANAFTLICIVSISIREGYENRYPKEHPLTTTQRESHEQDKKQPHMPVGEGCLSLSFFLVHWVLAFFSHLDGTETYPREVTTHGRSQNHESLSTDWRGYIYLGLAIPASEKSRVCSILRG